ncbi:MAG: class I SAM-dependent methyltransferase, partial [Bacteroidales bacterium]|nr:class I SAM-dependent methyltransferase [Bacteroidales bacterium]
MENEISLYNCLNDFRKPLLSKIINSLGLPSGSRGLDAGCGIGEITKLLYENIGESGDLTGLDFSKDLIQYAQNKNKKIKFIEGDVKSLPFADNCFDWVWSCDTVWTGPKEFGCPSNNPSPIIGEYFRVVKPGGLIVLLFWTSQKLLPGYPLLESKLNSTSSANAPFTSAMDPIFHVMNMKYWLKKSGLENIKAKTYLYDINAPLSKNDRKALELLFEMLWYAGKTELN